MNAVLVHSLYVGLGGFAGSVLRYLASVAVAGCGLWQPLATFGVNALGALILGAILACGAAGQGGAVARHLLAIGFCGGFTTFSTFSAEVLQLLRAQQQRKDRRLLAALRVLVDRGLGPGRILLGEGEAGGLDIVIG